MDKRLSRNQSKEETLQDSKRTWPNVPNLYGWLYLDRRGNWSIDNQIVSHERMILFLHNNYRKDNSGEWYVQNGPQKAFVDLEYTPLIFRLDSDGRLVTQTGMSTPRPHHMVLDDEGNVLFKSLLGIGLLDDRDIYLVADWIDENIDHVTNITWWGYTLAVKRVSRIDVPKLYGFNPNPSQS